MVVAICNFSHKNFVLISFIISFIILFFLNQVFFNTQNQIFDNSLEKLIPDNISLELEIPNNVNIKTMTSQNSQNIIENTTIVGTTIENTIQTNTKQEDLWQLEIPKINLRAQIAEGTSMEIMNSYIGHFEETPRENGNIGLAAHNRGYKVNYFKDIKLLEKEDLIIYTYNSVKIKYLVNETGIIKDTDWSKLENDNQDKITLITCLEDEPEYRRYVQAIKINK